jgi:hypothetical protein
VDTVGYSAATVAGRYLFSYDKLGNSYFLSAYPLLAVNSSGQLAVTDPSGGPSCSQNTGTSSSIAAVAINSTHYAIAIQSSSGTILEYQRISAVSFIATQFVSLFPPTSANAPRFPATGSSVVQNFNDTHVLLMWTSLRAAGSAALAASPRPGIPSVPIVQDGGISPILCPELVMPLSLVMDSTGARGIMLHSISFGQRSYAGFQSNGFRMTVNLKSSATLLLSLNEFSGIEAGTLPGFVSSTSGRILAAASSSYSGFIFNETAVSSESTSVVPLPPSTVGATVFATGRGSRQTLALTCSNGSYCTIEMAQSAQVKLSPVNSYST